MKTVLMITTRLRSMRLTAVSFKIVLIGVKITIRCIMIEKTSAQFISRLRFLAGSKTDSEKLVAL